MQMGKEIKKKEGKQMNGITMMVLAIVVLGGAYLLYGRYLEKKWGIDPKAKTPAFEMEDGVDYVPADTNVVFGHQFASIAGAGPINGPIQAAMFGWLPVLLWILKGYPLLLPAAPWPVPLSHDPDYTQRFR